MKVTTVQIKWGAVLTTVATLVALWATLNPWPYIGWTTPNQHDADYLEIAEDIKDFRDEWKCDEYEEELIELLEDVKAGDDSVETKREIERIREKIEKIKCDRFDDFG
jgi:hypothetical protein